MKCVILQVLNGLWVEIDEFDMILTCNMNGMVGYKCWHGIGMYNDFMLVGETWCWYA